MKQYFAEHYGSKRALNSPPHVTLQMPFKWRQDREELILQNLNNVAANFSSFLMVLDGFGFFEPRVVYLSVEESISLKDLHQEVSRSIRLSLKLVNRRGERPFRPHMTVAFRDLKKTQFYLARDEFHERKFCSEVEVDDICLLRHNGESWDIHKRFPLVKT